MALHLRRAWHSRGQAEHKGSPRQQHPTRTAASPPTQQEQVTGKSQAPGTGGVTPSVQRTWLSRAVAGAHGPPDWGRFFGTLFVSGALGGTLLDGIHSRTFLQVYDLAAVQLGPLHTSLLVPPLLGTWYCVMGALFCLLDNLASTAPSTSTPSSSSSSSNDSNSAAAAGAEVVPRFAGGGLAGVALAFGLLAANLQLSATLYEQGVAYTIIGPCLAATTAASWWLLDRTTRGAVLAAVCGVGAPAAEVVLMTLWHTWHYTQPDLAGVFVSWVPWCYAGYVPVLAVLSRYLWRSARG